MVYRKLIYGVVSILTMPFVSAQSRLQVFQSTPEALFWFTMFFLWFASAYLSVFKKSDRQKTVQAFNLLQVIIGFVIGINFINNSFMIGMVFLGVSAMIFIALFDK